MKKFKKVIASLLACSSMVLCMVSVSVSASTNLSYSYHCNGYDNNNVYHNTHYSTTYTTNSGKITGSASCTNGLSVTLRLYSTQNGGTIGSAYSINVYSSPVPSNFPSLNGTYKIGVSSSYDDATGHVTATGS